MPKAIIEIALEITENQFNLLSFWLKMHNVAYYVEPPRANPYQSLDEVEADCEGK